MKRKRKTGRRKTDVARKADRLICAKLDHLWPSNRNPFRRCLRCGRSWGGGW